MFRPLAHSLIFLGIAASANAEAAPRSLKELSDQVKIYQAKKDCDGMLSLFYTKPVDAERKKLFANTITQYLCGSFGQTIASVKFVSIPPEKAKPPGDFHGKPSQYTLAPLGALVIDYLNGPPGGTKTLSFRYGKLNDDYYLITTSQADKH